MPVNRRISAALPLILLSLAASGCLMPSYTLDPGKPMAIVDQPIDAPAIAVEFHAASGKIKPTTLPLEQGMTAQDAVDKTKAGKHFRRCNIDLVRTSPKAAQPHKMPLTWDGDRNRVAHSTNYALHPGDRLVVREDTSTIFDTLLAKLPGPKAKAKR